MRASLKKTKTTVFYSENTYAREEEEKKRKLMLLQSVGQDVLDLVGSFLETLAVTRMTCVCRGFYAKCRNWDYSFRNEYFPSDGSPMLCDFLEGADSSSVLTGTTPTPPIRQLRLVCLQQDTLSVLQMFLDRIACFRVHHLESFYNAQGSEILTFQAPHLKRLTLVQYYHADFTLSIDKQLQLNQTFRQMKHLESLCLPATWLDDFEFVQHLPNLQKLETNYRPDSSSSPSRLNFQGLCKASLSLTDLTLTVCQSPLYVEWGWPPNITNFAVSNTGYEGVMFDINLAGIFPDRSSASLSPQPLPPASLKNISISGRIVCRTLPLSWTSLTIKHQPDCLHQWLQNWVALERVVEEEGRRIKKRTAGDDKKEEDDDDTRMFSSKELFLHNVRLPNYSCTEFFSLFKKVEIETHIQFNTNYFHEEDISKNNLKYISNLKLTLADWDGTMPKLVSHTQNLKTLSICVSPLYLQKQAKERGKQQQQQQQHYYYHKKEEEEKAKEKKDDVVVVQHHNLQEWGQHNPHLSKLTITLWGSLHGLSVKLLPSLTELELNRVNLICFECAVLPNLKSLVLETCSSFTNNFFYSRAATPPFSSSSYSSSSSVSSAAFCLPSHESCLKAIVSLPDLPCLTRLSITSCRQCMFTNLPVRTLTDFNSTEDAILYHELLKCTKLEQLNFVEEGEEFFATGVYDENSYHTPEKKAYFPTLPNIDIGHHFPNLQQFQNKFLS